MNKYKQKGRYPVWLLVLALLITFSCNEKTQERKIDRSFYYWKSVFRLSKFEQQQIEKLNVKNIYIKFFDIDWDISNRRPQPVAKLQSVGFKLANGIQVIPTVFITNECLLQIDTSQIDQLAIRLTGLVKTMYSINQFPGSFTEIQIDCDWTSATKEKYFSLLTAIKLHSESVISATIRLHQVKFMFKTGIPPVNKGMLMCYNMGNLKNPATINSILETDELKKYIGNLSAYPLPLDLALPLFDWKVLLRQNEYKGLIQNMPDEVLNGSFTRLKENRYELLKDTLLQGYSLFKGDVIRSEESNYNEIINTANLVNKRLKNNPIRVVLYHLDSLLLTKYSLYDLENIYNSLR